MPWEIHAHEAFVSEMSNLPADDRSRFDQALEDLQRYVAATDGALGPAAPELDPDVPRPDLRPLIDASVRGSYRLRVGSLRATLAVLPSEAMVLMTALVRRSETTYTELVDRHERRLADR